MNRIDKLTDAQIKSLPAWRAKWIAIGLSTERANWTEFEIALRACYRYAKLRDDVPIIRVQSPIVGCLAAPLAADVLKILRQNGILNNLAVRSVVGSVVDSAVGSVVDSAVRSAVGSAVHSAVRSVVGSVVDLKIWWHGWFGGSLWPHWPAWTQFFFENCGLELGDINNIAKTYADTCRYGGYWWPNRDFIIACDRPSKIKRDDKGRLHCEDGMAIEWPDGWGLWMWHGIRVPAKLIMDPQAVAKEDIVEETNSEVSRAWAERLGWPKYFKLAEIKKLDAWLDPDTNLHYELYDFEKRLGDLQPRLFRMESPVLKDGTSPVYIEPVDPGLQTAKAARYWQFQKEDGSWPSVQESNKKPALSFVWEV